MMEESLARVVQALRNSQSILFITGAGLSADSGLPTYRGIGGLYNRNETEERIPIEEALSGEMFCLRPEITWKYILQIEQSCRRAVFNAGHRVIAAMENSFPRVWTLTQNIDGFHEKAGTRNLIDIHGDIRCLGCTRCPYRTRVENYEGLTIPPLCPRCGGMVRPEVVLFGEMLPAEKIRTLYLELRKGFDLVFSIGTTSVFPYIAEPVLDARRRGGITVEINPGPTEVTPFVDIKLASGAAETLQVIWEAYQSN